jgi:pyrimidine-nucleoside phosphorylase
MPSEGLVATASAKVHMSFLTIIESKREGASLSPAQIQRTIQDYTAGKIPDYQMAALLMAIFFQGLTPEETAALTFAMRDSGEKLSFPQERGGRPVVDKHSTGGIGDKVSLVLAPLLAALGFRVPMISGRGLGITGGTLDKLDAIPGYQTLLPAKRIVRQVQTVGCVICGQTESMVPADRKIYALRDATATVPSIPLITASILSKKLAEGLDALFLDVKFGRAAFMQTRKQARELARTMVELGSRCGVATQAVLSDMNVPLGKAAGNWLEVKESAECLDNRGPEDLRYLVIESAAHLLAQTGKAAGLAAGRRLAEASLSSGAAQAKWLEMLKAQGADLSAYAQLLSRDTIAPVTQELMAGTAGFVTDCDARILGEVVRDLGGGRIVKEDGIRYDVGIDQIAKPGERVSRKSVLARVHSADRGSALKALARLREAFKIAARPPKTLPLIREII